MSPGPLDFSDREDNMCDWLDENADQTPVPGRLKPGGISTIRR
jgi:hypothetical protein